MESLNKWEWRLLEAIIKQAMQDSKSNTVNETTGEFDIRNKAVKWLKSKKAERLMANTNIDVNYIRENIILQEKPPLSAEKLREYLVNKYGEQYVEAKELKEKEKARLRAVRKQERLEKRMNEHAEKIKLLTQRGERGKTKAS